MPIARNDKEVAKMLSQPVMEGLQVMAEKYLKPEISEQVSQRSPRGNFSTGMGGGLSDSWSWDSLASLMGFQLGEFRFYYDPSKLSYDPRGRHQTPEDIAQERGIAVERVTDIASIVDLGLGGSLFGEFNPTRTPTYFWGEGVIPSFESHMREWIKDGLTSVGLSVR